MSTIEVYNEYRRYLKNGGLTKEDMSFEDYKAAVDTGVQAQKADDEQRLLAALDDLLNDDVSDDEVVELGEFPLEVDEPEVEEVVQDTPVVVAPKSPKAPKSSTGGKRGRKGSAVKNAQNVFHANYDRLTSGELNRAQMIELMIAQGISKNTAIVQYAIQKKSASSLVRLAEVVVDHATA